MALTIPPAEEKHYDKYLCAAWPYFGIPMAIFLTFKFTISYTNPYFLIYLVPAVLWSLLFLLINKERHEVPW